jgi:lysophospholipid acyltransferase (LPLAT)-like uncharacterized protein
MPRPTSKLTYRLLAWIGPALVRLLGFTVRIERFNASLTDEWRQQNKPFILNVWHGRMFLPVFYHRNQGLVAMVSRHADGEVVARIVHKMGYGTVRGSSGKGGREAFLQLLAHLKKGGCAAMIPDGPLGPPCRLKVGTVMLAREAGCPLIPITYAAHSYWKLNTWDQTVLPKPFSRAVICYGDPVYLPAEATLDDLEVWRELFETAMNDLVKTAEERVGENRKVKGD